MGRPGASILILQIFMEISIGMSDPELQSSIVQFVKPEFLEQGNLQNQ